VALFFPFVKLPDLPPTIERGEEKKKKKGNMHTPITIRASSCPLSRATGGGRKADKEGEEGGKEKGGNGNVFYN